MEHYFPEIFLLGFKESLNPYALCVPLFLLVFLSRAGDSYKKVFFIGLTYSLLSAISCGLMYSGFFDFFLSKKSIVISMTWIYLVIGLFFVVYALLNFRDWLKLHSAKKNYNFFLKMPAFLGISDERLLNCDKKKTRKNKLPQRIIFYSMVFFVGSLLSVSQNIWPMDIYIYRLFAFYLSKGYYAYVFLFYGVYAVACVSPLFFLWFCVLRMIKVFEKKPVSKKFISYYKIIVSAIYLSIGIGLFYLYFLK